MFFFFHVCIHHQRNPSMAEGRDTVNVGVSHVATSQDRDKRNARLAWLFEKAKDGK